MGDPTSLKVGICPNCSALYSKDRSKEFLIICGDELNILKSLTTVTLIVLTVSLFAQEDAQIIRRNISKYFMQLTSGLNRHMCQLTARWNDTRGWFMQREQRRSVKNCAGWTPLMQS